MAGETTVHDSHGLYTQEAKSQYFESFCHKEMLTLRDKCAQTNLNITQCMKNHKRLIHTIFIVHVMFKNKFYFGCEPSLSLQSSLQPKNTF